MYARDPRPAVLIGAATAVSDSAVKLWPHYEHVTGDMLFAPVFPYQTMPTYVSLAEIAEFVGDNGYSRTTISDTAPAAPRVGDGWWVDGQLYLWIDDGSSTQWVAATNQPSVRSTTITTVSPASGATLALDGDTYVASGALAALTLRLPSMPVPGHRIEVAFAAPVAALTVQDAAGAAVAGAPTNAFGPGAALVFRYANGGPGWTYWK
jgi:hypothetical protein